MQLPPLYRVPEELKVTESSTHHSAVRQDWQALGIIRVISVPSYSYHVRALYFLWYWRIEVRAFHILGEYCTTELYPSPGISFCIETVEQCPSGIRRNITDRLLYLRLPVSITRMKLPGS